MQNHSLSDATSSAGNTDVNRSERKRLKHREYVKKSYNKKITTLENLRQELNVLDKQYAALLLSGSEKQDDGKANSSANSQSETLRKYLQASELKKWYQEENDRLYRLNASHMKIESRMAQLVDTSEAAKVPLPGVSSSRQYHIHPLSPNTYAGIIEDAMNDVLCFARSTEKLSTGARVLGWTDQREIHGRTLKFALQKAFSISPYELLQRSWGVFSNPDEFPKVYGSALNVKFYVLQYIDADTILFYRRIAPSAGSGCVVKTVFLLTRRQIAEGYLMLFRSIDKDLVHFEEVDVDGVPQIRLDPSTAYNLVSSEMWIDKYIWVLFYNIPKEPKKCLFHFGGATATSIWLREVLFVALRWENMVVGSQFTLAAE
ncbi:hypothetical protein BBP00_00003486 [Phytophthora kernoviae]|uniref:Uncharacterized protein n=1 Tax=Phytophthora kernoviae TaxID=325452 RepID=A0A3F2RU96_9STRA|nr:hypothetical protein BBP00_00003486 [Phytophthora kernoviae]